MAIIVNFLVLKRAKVELYKIMKNADIVNIKVIITPSNSGEM
jgi:hypothetical protein